MIDSLTALQVNKYIAMAQKKLVHKVYSIRLDVNRGHHGLTGLDRIELYYLERSLLILGVACKIAKRKNLLKYVSKSWKLIVRLLQIRRSICLFDSEVLWQNAPKYPRRYVTILSLAESDVLKFYRYKTKNQLHWLYRGFQFHSNFRIDKREKFTGEEVFLVGIRRLAYPNRT